MKLQQQRIYRERIFICPSLTTTVFNIMVVSQLLVSSYLTAWRVFKGDYYIGLTVLYLFLFSRVSYVLPKKMKSLFTLYRWFFRLWYESKDLKWWHSFLCQGVCNLFISWYPRDLGSFFSHNHFSQNSHLYANPLSKIWVEEYTESWRQELSVLQKILMLSLVFFNCSISNKNFQ